MSMEHDYAAVLNALVERTKQIGSDGDGDDVSLACYQILETAKSEAEVWGLPLAAIGLGGFDTESLLTGKKKAA